jgi:hypothetical protein
MTLICGKYLSASIRRAPTPVEMLYEANIKLMFGAKALTLYRYFGADNDTNFTGLVNFTKEIGYSYTERYWFIRNTLSPRLRGLLGKTLKNINQTDQYTNIKTSSFNSVKYVSDITASRVINNQETLLSTDIDLGFFRKDDKDFFMVINHYNNLYPAYKFTITINHQGGFKNYRINDYTDTTTWYIQNGSDFKDTIRLGDARLYSVLPVVRYGGSLFFEETIFGNNTLNEEMKIEAGATLTISSNTVYDVYKDITIEPGGKLVISSGADLKFHNGATLIAYGNLEIKGTISYIRNEDSFVESNSFEE